MNARFIDYLAETALATWSWVWAAVTGVASLAAYLSLGDACSQAERGLAVATVALATLIVGLILKGYRLYSQSIEPARIRQVVRGAHHQRGKLILVLDRAPWIDFDQILTLLDASEEVRTPICLLRVEGSTTLGFPQCVVLLPLTAEDLDQYLRDSARWGSLRAVPEVLADSFER